ncbi:MAG: hypothetical protein ACI4S4_06195 [Candidatus Ornithospirochaeta sp.]
MLMYVYLLILAFVVALIGVNLFKKKDNVWFQIDAGLVLITLVLRLLLIK